ncbi:MAG: DUF4981 domain-containing protein, partial [Bacteroidales bacterium]|nr:DUF4981 domain-containing protein [Bacteroidales bacterium]
QFDLVYEFTSDGKRIQTGKLASVSLLPGKSGTIEIPVPDGFNALSTDVCLNLYVQLKKANLWASEGYSIAREQFVVKPGAFKTIKAADKQMTVKETAGEISVQADSFKVVFSKSTGAMTSWVQNNSELLQGVLEPYFWKPANDNQKQSNYERSMGVWRKVASNRVVEGVDVTKPDGLVTLLFRMNLPDVEAGYTLKYTLNSRGQIQVEADYKPKNEKTPKIPKFGMRIRIPEKFQSIQWYGRGVFENYPDRKTAAFIGVYTSTLDNFRTDYAVPQDNGNRCDVRWFSLADQKGNAVRVSGLQPLCFRAWPYTEEELEKAKHPFDLPVHDFINLNIDLNIHGVGGDDTWGAQTMEKYTYPGNKPYQYGFVLEYMQNMK